MAAKGKRIFDENVVRENLLKHRRYMGMHFDWKDLVIHYNLFTAAEVNDIKVKAKTDQLEATELALDLILKSNIPNRFSVLIEALDRAGFQKPIDILQGICEPSNEFHRMIISCCQKYILENLDPNEVLNQLASQKVIRDSDALAIRHRGRMEGPSEANFELLTRLPKLHPDWYFIFVQTLKDCKHGELAKIIEARENLEATSTGNVIPPSVHYKGSQSFPSGAGTRERTVGVDNATAQHQTSITKVTNCHKKCRGRRDFYCPKHKTRYCNFCHFSQHKPCSVFDLAYEVKVDIRNIEKDLEYLKACIAWNGEYREQLEIQTGTLIKDIEDEREKIAGSLKDLENSIVTLKSKGSKRLDDEIETLSDELKNITSLKEARQLASESCSSSTGFETAIADMDLLFASKRVDSILTKREKMGYPGKIMVEGWNIREIILDYAEKRHAVKESKLKLESFNIAKEVGCCLLHSDTLVFCDREEMELQIYQNRELIDNLDLQFMPWDVVIANEHEVLVSMPESKMIKYVSFSDRLEIDREISTPKPCWRLFCTDSDIYGCCGNKGTSGEVQIFDQSGGRKTCFPNEISNTKIEGMRIYVRGKSIYATFAESVALHVTNTENGNSLSLGHKRLVNPTSVYVNSEDMVFIGDLDTNKLQVFRIVDEVLVLLKSYDLNLQPQHILEGQTDQSLVLVGISTGL